MQVNAGLFYRNLLAAVGKDHEAFLKAAFESNEVLKPDKEAAGTAR